MENQEGGNQVVDAVDDAPSPSNSSNGASLTFVGDVDERVSTENAQLEKTENDLPTMAKGSDALFDDDSFVMVDAIVEKEKDSKKSEEEAIAKAKAEAEAKRKAEEEAVAARAAAEAAAKKKAEEEAAAKAAAEAEAKRKAEEEAIAKAKAEAEARRQAEEEAAAAKAAAEAEAKKKAEEEAAKKAEEEAAAKAAAEAEAKRKAEEEAAAKAAAEAEAKRKAEEKAAAEAAAKKKAEEEAASRAAAEEEATKKAEEEAEVKAAAEAEAAKKAEQEDDDDLDLDALLDDSIDGKEESDVNDNMDDEEASHLKENNDKDIIQMDSFDLPEQFIIPKENEGDPDLDALLDDSDDEMDDSAIPTDILNIEQALEDSLAEAVKDMSIDNPTEKNEDKEALELDALLDDSEKEGIHQVDFEVIDDKAIEDTTTLEVKSTVVKNDETRRTSSFGQRVVSNASNIKTRSTPKPKDTVTEQKTIKSPLRKVSTGTRKKTPAKKSTNEVLNISSSISDTVSNSMKKVVSARDRMKEYSRELSSRASSQRKKNTTTPKRENETKEATKSPFVSSASKRLFASSIPTPTTTKVEVEEKWKGLKSQLGENIRKTEFKNYMKATVSFKSNVVESQRVRQIKTALKESNAKKILVNMSPWKTGSTSEQKNRFMSPPSVSKRVADATSGTVSSISRVANNVLTRRQKAHEREKEMKMRSPYFSPQVRNMTMSPLSTLASPLTSRQKRPKESDECIVFSNDKFFSPARSTGGLTTGSLSSLCTVESFVNPTKEGIVGCQNKYEPYLHKIRGPCELCVFRLSDAEKEKLDTRGRHLMVQFTTGGCRDCKAFPKAIGEMPVRLCPRCYTHSHRRVQTRRRKKGSGSHIGYSFAKMIAESEMRL